MSNLNNEFLRYLLLDKRLRQEPLPPLQNLKDYLDAELKEAGCFVLTPLSIKGDLKRMRRLFHAPIGFSFAKNCYHYKSATYTLLKLQEAVLDSVIIGLILNLSLGEKYTSLENIQYEHARTYARGECIPAIAKAFAEKKELKIRYKSLGAKRSREYSIIPYLLKVVQGKWVLYGEADGTVKGYLLEEVIGIPEVTNTKAEIPSMKEIDKAISAISTPAKK
ncbi:MAG: WYL domain-containing protein [Bacteroidia bacterium]